jgi:outer membrane protein assembly factor BamB
MRAYLTPQRLGVLGGILALLVVLNLDDDSTGDVRAEAGAGKADAKAVAMFGVTPARNLANTTEKNILGSGEFVVRPANKQKNVKWAVKLGSMAYGGPVVAGGRIFVGTNNANPRDKKVKGDRGIVMCFRESDGKFLWQIVHDKLPGGAAVDCPQQGVASTPCVEGDRLYYVSNRCELVCADVAGDEKTGKGKVIWTYDMIKELEVFPCQLANSSPLIVGDLVYALTGNGVDAGTGKFPNPKAPGLVAVNKKTGKLAWSCNLPGSKVMRGQWSNPTAATVGGKTQVLFAGGDGWMYGLDAKTGALVWKFDCNPKDAGPYKFGGSSKRCFIVGTPVVYDQKCYIAVGQEPDEGPGIGHLWCIDITKKPKNKEKDLSPVNDNFDPKAAVNKDSGLVWHYGGPVVPKPKDEDREYVFGRTLGTVAIHDGLVYASELAGFLHCVDARTGKKVWEFDFQDGMWCSPYYVDGKVFVGTDNGELYTFQAGRKLIKPKKTNLGQGVKVPPTAANGVLYVNGSSNLFAIARK